MQDIKKLSDLLLHYGIPMNFDLYSDEPEGCRRVRIYKYEGHIFIHHMFDGQLVEVYELEELGGDKNELFR